MESRLALDSRFSCLNLLSAVITDVPVCLSRHILNLKNGDLCKCLLTWHFYYNKWIVKASIMEGQCGIPLADCQM